MAGRWTGPLLLLPAALAAFALAESAARLVLPDRPAFPFHLRPPASRFVVEPPADQRRRVNGGALHTYDQRWFRTQPVVDHPEATVLFLGDSIAEGFGVADDQTLVAAAQRDLQAHGRAVQCLNAAEAGAGGATELDALDVLLPRVRPDLAVLVLFPGNDLTDDWRGGTHRIEDGRLVRQDPPVPPPEVARGLRLQSSWLATRSRLARALMGAWWDECDFLPEPDDAMVALHAALRVEALARLRAAGVPALVVLVPNRLQAGVVSSPGEVWCGNRGTVASYGRIAQAAAGWGVPLVDLRNAGLGPGHYLEGDEHLSAEGGEVAGRAVAQRIGEVLAVGTAAP